MKQSIENAARTLAVTVALATGMTGVAQAETKPPVSRKGARATKLAGRLTKELYDTKGFPKGAPVRGILNGSVEIHESIGNTIAFKNPVILVESHPAAQSDAHGKLLDGSWIGIPATNAEGQLSIEPVQLNLGEQDGESQSLHLRAKHNTVLEGAAIYASHVTDGPDALVGFDRTGEDNFPAVHIQADGMK